MNYFLQLARLLRPHQWIKSAFVFTGLLFGHAWHNPVLVYQTIIIAIAFSLLSSAVYIYNDIIDLKYDQQHPTKKYRPLAQGTVSITTAITTALLLAILSLIIGFTIATKVGLIFIGYIILNIFYNYYSKHIVILDVFTIAAGFILRILAGTFGVGIPPSQWLMLCSLMLTLFLSFAKRRSELIACKQTGLSRKVLRYYNPALLDKMISVTAASTIISYSFYTISTETIQIHGTHKLIYTVPFVIYGIFRYIYLLHKQVPAQELDTATELLTDWHLLIAILGWLITTVWLIV